MIDPKYNDIKELVENRLTPKQLERYNKMTGYYVTRLERITKAGWVSNAIAEIERRDEARIEAKFDYIDRQRERLRKLIVDHNLTGWNVGGSISDEPLLYISKPALNGAMVDVGEITEVQVQLFDDDYTGGLVESTDGWRRQIHKKVKLADLAEYANKLLNTAVGG
jgi:hypothetical protein